MTMFSLPLAMELKFGFPAVFTLPGMADLMSSSKVHPCAGSDLLCLGNWLQTKANVCSSMDDQAVRSGREQETSY